jgi:hypothetical protein
MRADLHIHTHYSDGFFPTEKLIDLAEKSRLDYLAITDHDCFAACPEAKQLIAERGLPMTLIPAAEFTAMLEGEEIHIHGYFKEFPSARMQQYVKMVQDERRKRIERALEVLATIGVKADMEEIPAHPDNESLTQLHLAFLLMEKKYVESFGEARRVYLTDRVLPKFSMRAEDVIQTINSEGGLAVWAHPEEARFDHELKMLIGFGLGGVEVLNLRRQDDPSKRFIRAAKKHNLVTTLGSDWHGHSHSYHYERQLECDKILAGFLKKMELP